MIEPASLTALIGFPFVLVFTYTFTKCVRRVQSWILEDFGILFSEGWWHQLKYINWIQLWDNSVIWDILACFRGLDQINLPKRKLKFGIKAWDTDDIRIQVAPGKFPNCLMYRSISNSNIPVVLKFSVSVVKFQSPSCKKQFKCPKYKTQWMGKCPTLGPSFYRLTGQDRFKLVILLQVPMDLFWKKEFRTSVQKRPWVSTAHFWSAIRHERSILSAKIASHFHFAIMMTTCTIGQIPDLPQLSIKSPTFRGRLCLL